MVRKMKGTILGIVSICLILTTGLAIPATYTTSTKSPSRDFPLDPLDKEILKAIDFLKLKQKENGEIGDPMTTAWAAMALCSANAEMGNISIYLERSISKLDPKKVTDWERHALAVVACGEDPTNFGGINFVEKIKTFYDGEQIGSKGLLNDDIWGIIALVSCGVDKNDPVVQGARNYIILHQNADGGWGVGIAGNSDVDSTSSAIMALIACGVDRNSSIIQKALDFLRKNQLSDGGFSSWGSSNSASTSWAIMAISCAGENPENWIKNGKSPVDYLLSLQNDDGSFRWNETLNLNPEWMTSYAIPALLGKYYPVKIYHSYQAEAWTGYIRIEGKEKTVWEGSVTVKDTTVIAINVSSNEKEEHYIPYPSALGALVEASKKGVFNCTILYYPSWDALYVKSIDGDSDWWHYWVDYELPMMSSDKYKLTEDDREVLWGYVETWEAHALKISVDKKEVKRNEVFTIKVKDENDNPVSNATVHINSYTFLSDSDGSVKAKIPRQGVYKVYAEKEGYVRSQKVEIKVTRRILFLPESIERILHLIETIISYFLQMLGYSMTVSDC